MNERTFGMIFAAGGALLVLLSVLADPIGVGGNEDTFGWKQWVGVAVGVVSIAAGGALAAGLLKRPRS